MGRNHIKSDLSPECGTQPSSGGGVGAGEGLHARNRERLWVPFLASFHVLLAKVVWRPKTADFKSDTLQHTTYHLPASRYWILPRPREEQPC